MAVGARGGMGCGGGKFGLCTEATEGHRRLLSRGTKWSDLCFRKIFQMFGDETTSQEMRR